MSSSREGLAFRMFSGGVLSVDYRMCAQCTTQACVRHCVSSTLDPVLKIKDGVPVLARLDQKPESGWCIECLACELDCQREGRGALKISFEDDLVKARENGDSR